MSVRFFTIIVVFSLLAIFHCGVHLHIRMLLLQVPAPFLWDVPPPFSMSPSEGEVGVGESTAVTCSLRPTDASVFVSQAVLKVGQGVNAIKPSPLLEMKVRVGVPETGCVVQEVLSCRVVKKTLVFWVEESEVEPA